MLRPSIVPCLISFALLSTACAIGVDTDTPFATSAAGLGDDGDEDPFATEGEITAGFNDGGSSDGGDGRPDGDAADAGSDGSAADDDGDDGDDDDDDDAGTGTSAGMTDGDDDSTDPTDPTDPTDAGDDGPQPSQACCAPQASAGCADGATEACVCAADAFCCDSNWDVVCVAEVESLDCADCGTADDEALCEAACTTYVACDDTLPYDTVPECMPDCLALLDDGASDGSACPEALAFYNACIGLLTCSQYDDHVTLTFTADDPCEAPLSTIFDACPTLFN